MTTQTQPQTQPRVTADPYIRGLRNRLHNLSIEQLQAIRKDPGLELNKADKALLTRYIHIKQNPAAYSMNPAQKKAAAINYMLHAVSGALGNLTNAYNQAFSEARQADTCLDLAATNIRLAEDFLTNAKKYLQAYNAEKVAAGKAKKSTQAKQS